MNFRPRQRHSLDDLPRLSLVAFIDVVLFILLYFLMAGSLAAPERDLSSALGAQKASTQKAAMLTPQVINVSVESGAAVFRIGQRSAASRDGLSEILRSLVHDQGVFIKAADDAPIAAVAAAVQAAHDAGFTRISYVAGR